MIKRLPFLRKQTPLGVQIEELDQLNTGIQDRNQKVSDIQKKI